MVGTGSNGLGSRHRSGAAPPSRGVTESPLRSLGAAKVVEDAADDAALGNEGDHPHHASAATTDQRIGLVNPAKELSPRPGNLNLVLSIFEEGDVPCCDRYGLEGMGANDKYLLKRSPHESSRL